MLESALPAGPAQIQRCRTRPGPLQSLPVSPGALGLPQEAFSHACLMERGSTRPADAPGHRLAVSLVAQRVLAQVNLLLPLRQAVRVCLALRLAPWPARGCSKVGVAGWARCRRAAAAAVVRLAEACILRGGAQRDSRAASSTTKSAVTSRTPLIFLRQLLLAGCGSRK